MKPNNALQVLYDERLVGMLAMTADHKAAFQYSEEWLEHGFPISPFSLPLKRQVFVPNKDYFDGLFGVFADSLPDNWGRLLLRTVKTTHFCTEDISTMEPMRKSTAIGAYVRRASGGRSSGIWNWCARRAARIIFVMFRQRRVWR